MIYLLLGKDSFGKRQFLTELAASLKSETVEIDSPLEEREVLNQTSGGSLFASSKLVIVHNALQKIEAMPLLNKIAKTADTVVFVETSLDKRKKETKELLADKRIHLKEFEVPTGSAFINWIELRAKKFGFEFERGAAQELAKRLGDDGRTQTEYDLWQADSEIQKLNAFADGKKISKEDVEKLVAESIDQDIFKVTNAIADRNKELTAKYLSDFIERSPGTDEKSKIINLAAVLAEQFRGLYSFASMLARGAGDAEIASLTGFTPGRIFVYKKLSRSIDPKKLLIALKKIEALDVDLKTSNAPASLEFYMIIHGLIK